MVNNPKKKKNSVLQLGKGRDLLQIAHGQEIANVGPKKHN
jgi:hypothetical protein